MNNNFKIIIISATLVGVFIIIGTMSLLGEHSRVYSQREIEFKEIDYRKAILNCKDGYDGECKVIDNKGQLIVHFMKSDVQYYSVYSTSLDTGKWVNHRDKKYIYRYLLKLKDGREILLGSIMGRYSQLKSTPRRRGYMTEESYKIASQPGFQYYPIQFGLPDNYLAEKQLLEKIK